MRKQGRTSAHLKSWWPRILLALVLVAGAVPALAAPGDIVFGREDDTAGVPPAVFPHWVHRIRYRCSVCHPAIFEMEAGANEISMELIGDGKSCGRCHDGNTAFPVDFQSCTRCHREPSE